MIRLFLTDLIETIILMMKRSLMKPSRDHWLKEKMITELVLEALLTAKKVELRNFSVLFKKMMIYSIIEFDY